MKIVLIFVVAAAFGAFSALPVSAAEKWDQIGKEKLKDKQGETSFRIGVEDGRYRFIKFRAEGGDVQLDEVTISFLTGDDQKVERLGKIRDGKESRPITVGVALKSTIKKISVKYETDTEDKVNLLVLAKKK
jgi:hypothetical protein